MAKKQSTTVLDEAHEVPEIEAIPGFTGIARSVQCYNNNGQFRNFRVLTLHIQNGRVVRTDYSDPYASWETIAKMELWNLDAVLNLNDNWVDGKTLSK